MSIMTRGPSRSSLRTAVLLVLSAIAICCSASVDAQSHSSRSVHRAGSATQHRSHDRHHANPSDDDGDEDEDEDEDDWDFMSDAAILSLAAQQQQQQHSATAATELCAQTLPLAYLNDDYCDCADGSDEPRTAACSHILPPEVKVFQCGSGSDQAIASALVGDGVCDCCDGSDESSARVACPNTCAKRQDERIAALQTQLDAVHDGLHVRDEYTAQYSAAVAHLRTALDETLGVATAIQRAFEYKQSQLTARGTQQPSPQEMHQLEAMYQQLRGWQYRAYVQQQVLAPATFEDREWKAPFAALVGACFRFEANEKELKGGTVNVIPRTYVFSLCPFQNLTQHEPSYPAWTRAERRAKHSDSPSSEDDDTLPDAPAPILLGIWSEWTAPSGAASSVTRRTQHYNYGHQCANGEHRQAHVTITCGATDRVESIEENDMCVYTVAFASPAACDERERVALERELERLQRSGASQDSASVASTHEEL